MSNLLQRRGNSIYLRIREYMMKNISINIIIIFLVFQGLLKEHNITLLNHPYDQIYYENYVLEELEYYLKEVKYNKNLTKSITNYILPKFIENDNKRIKKLFRKIIIIKKRSEQKQMMINFNRWFMNIKNFNDDIKKKRNKEKKAKNELDKKENNCKNNNLIQNNKDNYKNKHSMNNALNLKLLNKNNKNRTSSYSYKNNKCQKSKNNSAFTNKTSPDVKFNDSQISSMHINQYKNVNYKNEIKRKINDKNINKSCSLTREKKIIILTSKNKTSKTPNKNQNMVKEFMNNLIINQKNKEEKIRNLSVEHEKKINSIYTFTPKIIGNKKNEKYLKNMLNKFLINNPNENIKSNNIYNNSILGSSNINNSNQLDVVMEENRQNKDINFISRLNEYEKIKINNLERIKNDILISEYISKNTNNHNNNNEKFNIIENHLLNSSTSYFQDKKRKIDIILRNIEEEKGITFEPKLNNEYNNRIKEKFKNLKEDLVFKKNEKAYDYLSNRDKECTFHPKINEMNSISYCNNSSNVGDRLLAYQDKYNQKLDLLKSKCPKYSFKPKLSKNTSVILNKKRLIKKLKGKIKANISVQNYKEKFEEKKNKLKMNQIYKKYEDNKENSTPLFIHSKNENHNKINFEDFDKISEYSESSTNAKNFINQNIKSSLINNNYDKRIKKNNYDKNLMCFDYYEQFL